MKKIKINCVGFVNRLLLLFVISALYFACKHEIPFPTVPGTGGVTPPPPVTPPQTCSPDSVYFTNEILPLITSTCSMSSCHDAVSHREGVTLTNYSNIKNYVVAGNASGSKLYKEVIKTSSSRMPPPPMPAWTADQTAKLQKWINQGAKNNSCTSCDATAFKYSTNIQPVIQTQCVGCHNAASLGGNIDLSTYNGVKAVALNGKLYGSITFSTGFSAMPQGGNKMSDCQITQIKNWIDAGSLNN